SAGRTDTEDDVVGEHRGVIGALSAGESLDGRKVRLGRGHRVVVIHGQRASVPTVSTLFSGSLLLQAISGLSGTFSHRESVLIIEVALQFRLEESRSIPQK